MHELSRCVYVRKLAWQKGLLVTRCRYVTPVRWLFTIFVKLRVHPLSFIYLGWLTVFPSTEDSRITCGVHDGVCQTRNSARWQLQLEAHWSYLRKGLRRKFGCRLLYLPRRGRFLPKVCWHEQRKTSLFGLYNGSMAHWIFPIMRTQIVVIGILK